MNNIEVGDTVKVPGGEKGEVIEIVERYDILSFGNPIMKVKIDGVKKEKEFEKIQLTISEKKPNSKQALEALNNIKQEINSNNFPNPQQRESGELNNHLKYAEEYIKGENKVSPIPDLNYVEERLKVLNSVKCKEVIEPNLKTLRWWARYN